MQGGRSYKDFTREYLQRIGRAAFKLSWEVEEVAGEIWGYLEAEGQADSLSEEQRFEAADVAVKKKEDEVMAAAAVQETLNTRN
jgi:hypothetical protein